MMIKRSNPTVRYVTNEIAAGHGHDVLRLPVDHCELNPIELVWAQSKGYAASHNKDFTMAGIEKLAEGGISNLTAERWRSCVEHVIHKVEDHYRVADGVVEEAVERVVIELRRGEDDSSDSEEAFVSECSDDGD